MSTQEPDARGCRRRSSARPAPTRPSRSLFDASMELIGERAQRASPWTRSRPRRGVQRNGLLQFRQQVRSDRPVAAPRRRHLLKARSRRLRPAADPPEAMEAMLGQAMDFMADYPSFARLWVSENWRTPSVGQDLCRAQDRTLGRDRRGDRNGRRRTRWNGAFPGQPRDGDVRSDLRGGPGPETYNPERSRDQSVAAIMAIMRGYVLR